MRDIRSVGQSAKLAGEYQVVVDPTLACGQPLKVLPGAVGSKAPMTTGGITSVRRLRTIFVPTSFVP